MNFICLNSNTSCHILHKSYQEPVTKVKMNLHGQHDRKYMTLNLLILEDNLHVENTIFMFTLSVRYVMCLYLIASHGTFYAVISATALLLKDCDINIFLTYIYIYRFNH